MIKVTRQREEIETTNNNQKKQLNSLTNESLKW